MNFFKELGLIEYLLIGLMIFLALAFIKKVRKDPKVYSTIPNIIAALGIIGTFIGIFIGLMNFDTNNIDASIPKLLEGMKTAFITSIVGLVLSNVILKPFQSRQIKKNGNNSERELGEVSLEKIANLMIDVKEALVGSNQELIATLKEIKDSNVKASEENSDSMKNLVNSLTGSHEMSLVSQMKDLKEGMVTAQKEAQDKLNFGLEKMGNQLDSLVKSNNSISEEIMNGNNILIDEFRKFAKNMAENNMKAFTDAIQECIKDLNNQLQEQFGENFKHLNLAVEKLLEWQINYKATIEKSTENQLEIYEGMKKARDLIVDINERSLSIVEVANKLGDKIITLDSQEQHLNSSIEILNRISLEAKEIIPNLDSYIMETKNTVKSLAENIEVLATNTHEKMVKSIENIEGYVENADSKLLSHTESATDMIASHLKTVTETGIENLNVSSGNILEKISHINEDALNRISSLSDHFVNESKKSIENIDTVNQNMNNLAEDILSNISATSEAVLVNIDNSNQQLDNYLLETKNTVKTVVENVDKLTNNAYEKMAKSIENIEEYVQNADSKLLDHTEKATVMINSHLKNVTETGIENLNVSSGNILEKISHINEDALNRISSLSDHFANESKKSIENIDTVNQNMSNLAKDILSNISGTSESVIANMNNNNQQIENTRAKILELTRISTENIAKQQTEILEALSNFKNELEVASDYNIKAIEKQIESIERAAVKLENDGMSITKKISDNIQVMVENNNANIQTSVDNINMLLNETLNKALESLGEQLAAVSEKFVNDYIPLTQELKKVVEIAKGLGD